MLKGILFFLPLIFMATELIELAPQVTTVAPELHDVRVVISKFKAELLASETDKRTFRLAEALFSRKEKSRVGGLVVVFLNIPKSPVLTVMSLLTHELVAHLFVIAVVLRMELCINLKP